MGKKDTPAKNKHSVHFSTGKDNWTTPKEFFEDLDEVWGFTLDAACVEETALCDKFFTPEDDSLSQDWGNNIVWLNPPYSDLKTWLSKAVDAYNKGATVLILVPSRTDTIAFQEYASKLCDCICFIKGRLKFGIPEEPDKKTDSAPFPSCLIVLDKYLTPAKINHLKSIGQVMKNI